jgi:hypothetical protein
MYLSNSAIGGDKDDDMEDSMQVIDQKYYNTNGKSGTSTTMSVQLFENRKSKLWEWVNNNEKACNKFGIDKADYAFGNPKGI